MLLSPYMKPNWFCWGPWYSKQPYMWSNIIFSTTLSTLHIQHSRQMGIVQRIVFHFLKIDIALPGFQASGKVPWLSDKLNRWERGSIIGTETSCSSLLLILFFWLQPEYTTSYIYCCCIHIYQLNFVTCISVALWPKW